MTLNEFKALAPSHRGSLIKACMERTENIARIGKLAAAHSPIAYESIRVYVEATEWHNSRTSLGTLICENITCRNERAVVENAILYKVPGVLV